MKLYGRLKTLLAERRKRERERLAQAYVTMTPDEREELEAIRLSGAAGERDVRIERAAEHTEEALEGRPPEYVDAPAGSTHAPSREL
jgi:hypothetical protein